MEIYLKAVCGILICTILSLILSKQAKDFSGLLIICACCLVLVGAVGYLKPVFALIDRLAELGQLNGQMLSILLKSVGIALISEVTCLVCVDAGAGAMGKALQVLATAVILWLSIPLFNELINLVEKILSNT